MTNVRKDGCNATQLYVDRAEGRGIIHRDYIAHCLRWSFSLRFIDSSARVLDVGCGEAALLKTLYVNKYHPELYAAVDIRDMAPKLMAVNFPVDFRQLDITQADLPWPDASFDVVTCFEVFEHFPAEAARRVLAEIARVLRPGGFLLLSTPNFDEHVGPAENHPHEWPHDELNALVSAALPIESEFGTFASQRDVKPVMSAAEREVFDGLRAFWDSNLISVFIAPLHHREARNCLRVCRKPSDPAQSAAAEAQLAAAEADQAASGPPTPLVEGHS